jgi:hypothetical protein
MCKHSTVEVHSTRVDKANDVWYFDAMIFDRLKMLPVAKHRFDTHHPDYDLAKPYHLLDDWLRDCGLTSPRGDAEATEGVWHPY